MYKKKYSFTKHAATEPAFPWVLKLTAPKLHLKMSTKRNVLYFRLLTCTNAEPEKGKGVPHGPRADNLYCVCNKDL